MFARTYPVKANFADAAGISSGDKVTVAGLDAGTVKGVHIQGSGVVMDLAVDRGVTLPGDTRANVVIQTLLGKRVVDLAAGTDHARTLQQVGFIPRDHTTTPIDITDLNDISVRLLTRSDAGALNELLREVTTITQGKRADVTKLVSNLADLTQAVDERRTELGGLITAFKKLSTTLGERSGTIVSLVDNLTPVLQNLANHQQDLKSLLVATDAATHETANLVARNRPVLDKTLNSLHEDLNVINNHELDLAAGVSYLEQSVQGYSSVAYSGGTCGDQQPPCARGTPNHWANIFVQSLGPLGVDAILGQCGLVDQLIDQILGTNCNDFPDSSKGAQHSGAQKPAPAGPSIVPKLPQAPMPGNLGDLVNSALGGGR